MTTEEEITKYMNLIARACAVVTSYPDGLNNLSVMPGFRKTYDGTWNSIGMTWLTKNSVNDFIACIESEIDEIEAAVEDARYIKALAICLWLEENITYDDRSASDAAAFFSVSQLLQFDGVNKFVIIEAMNTNFKETCIQIIPKFEICRHWDSEEGTTDNDRANPYANRDAFTGLNGKTHKVSFIKWKKDFFIHNIVLSPRFIPNIEDVLNIAFCPLTNSDLLEKEYITVTDENPNYEAVKISGIREPDVLLKRLEEDWRHACSVGKADIIFYPEALGTHLSEEAVNGERYNKRVFAIAKEESKKGNKLPILTVLPSFCTNGENKASLLDKNGFIVAKQSKYEPYYNSNRNYREYLHNSSEKHYYVIHVPKLHRISVLICADFLAYDQNDAEKLFTEVGCTLLLVPSYSHGELDFVNKIQTLRPYGTTVIWGNSCGAAGDPRVIGGCCVAGFDRVLRFNDYRDCAEGCAGVEKCAFIVSIPLRLAGSKTAKVTDITVKRI